MWYVYKKLSSKLMQTLFLNIIQSTTDLVITVLAQYMMVLLY